ncbi:hypothetical protein [Bacillus pretiosus]
MCEFKPILTDLIIQDNRERVFHVNNPIITAKFLLSTIYHWVD